MRALLSNADGDNRPARRRCDGSASWPWIGVLGVALIGVLAAACDDSLPPIAERDAALQDGGSAGDGGGGGDAAAIGDAAESDALGNTICTRNVPCASADEYCSFEAGCGFEGVGACQPKPIDCPAVVDQVCGCNGAVYNNACVAASAGVSVASSGDCLAACRGINSQYEEAVAQAKACDATAGDVARVDQCTHAVDNDLLCGCKTHINQGNVESIDRLPILQKRWDDLRCAGIWGEPVCTACFTGDGGRCDPVNPDDPSLGGSCLDLIF